jgi:phage-related protein
MKAKNLSFRGSSLDDLRAFPADARREAGFQLDKVQQGIDPDDWKAITTIGPGVKEIRIWDEAGTFRVVYLAKLPDAVYVLHCFHKKTEEMSQQDIRLAQRRYKDLIQEYMK